MSSRKKLIEPRSFRFFTRFICGKRVPVSQLAFEMGITHTNLVRALRGQMAISIERAEHVAKFLGITVEKLAKECKLVKTDVWYGKPNRRVRLVPADPERDHNKLYYNYERVKERLKRQRNIRPSISLDRLKRNMGTKVSKR